jgi:hypothetical protein
MTVENEESKKVSNEQLLLDIRITKKEVSAFDKIAAGFSLLCEEPHDLGQGDTKMARVSSQRFKEKSDERKKFLAMLNKLKKERGLK